MKSENKAEQTSGLQSTLLIALLSVPAILFASRFEAATPPDQTVNGIKGQWQTSSNPRASETRDLSAAERYAYQRAIEAVYWRHRIWPNSRQKPSLDEVTSPAQIASKVENYLRNSQVLEEYWNQPITPLQLQAEMERMARDTKQPDMLRELFAALGNDPFVIAECLARPVLAESLVANLGNQAVSVDLRDQKQKLAVTSPTEDVLTKIEAAATEFLGYTVPDISGTHGPTTTLGCPDGTWTNTGSSGPSARFKHTAVWTGSEMIIWGGGTSATDVLGNGATYNPGTDSWTATSQTNAPPGRFYHTAVWTGTEMIVWGGDSDASTRLNTGGRYNPATNSWTATSLTDAPSPRGTHTAVWTGSEMIVWGGSGDLNTGGRYNPSTDSWTATSLTNAPPGRLGHTAVWTGSEMIVWGSADQAESNTGGRYNPATDSWTATSLTNVPQGRSFQSAVWTGSEMIVWGGTRTIRLNTGGRYNPATDTWTATSMTTAPEGRAYHTAVWTGSEMVIWGGDRGGSSALNSGGKYNPVSDSWTPTSLTNAPEIRYHHTAVWTGTEMIVWGGFHSGILATGSRLCVQAAPLAPSSLGNISTRLRVETGENVLIGGFIVTGTQTKRVIVRAIGPSLSSFFPDALIDPTLELRDSSGALIRSNDNWRSDQETEIIATGVQPGNDLEAAIVAPLPANNSAYTAIVRGVANGTGIGVVEAYDLDQTVDSKLANISTRGLVQTGNNVLIAGTIVLGQTPQRVLVRAIGPSLPVGGTLANPTLELRDGNGSLVRMNDNWRSDQEAEIIATTIPPTNDMESALIETLPAGGAAYTAIVSGAGGTTGVAIVEVYGLN